MPVILQKLIPILIAGIVAAVVNVLISTTIFAGLYAETNPSRLFVETLIPVTGATIFIYGILRWLNAYTLFALSLWFLLSLLAYGLGHCTYLQMTGDLGRYALFMPDAPAL